MKREEAEKLFALERKQEMKTKEIAEKLKRFLSNHKGEWFDEDELAKELGVTATDIVRAFGKLEFSWSNFILTRYESKYLWSSGLRLYRKRW
jgi:predicted transcriptional regulator